MQTFPSAQIATEAKDAVSPVAREYDRAVSATSAHLQGASKTVWIWFAAAAAILFLLLFIGWAVLGYYRRELSIVQAELQRYESAIPVLQHITHPMLSFAAAEGVPTSIPMGNGRATSASIDKPNRDPSSKVASAYVDRFICIRRILSQLTYRF
ncbi:hypothetical protein ACFQS6_05605 [Xanthomonas populi]